MLYICIVKQLQQQQKQRTMKKKSIYGHSHEITAKGEMTLKNGKKRKLVYTKENDWMLKSDFRINDEEYLSLPTKEL